MNSNRIFAILCFTLVAVGGVILYRSFYQESPEKTLASSRKSGGTPGAKFNSEKIQARSAKSIHLSKSDNIGTDVQEKDLVKQSAPITELDAKFATRHIDGRKAVEAMFGGDREKISAAFRAAMQNEEFRGNFTNMRELEAKYSTASDDQKQGIMEQLQAIRERGLNILRQSAATAPPANDKPVMILNANGTSTLAPLVAPAATPANAPAAAPAPVVFQ